MQCRFRRIGVFPEVGFKLGRFHDVGFWVLLIAPADAPYPVHIGASLRKLADEADAMHPG